MANTIEPSALMSRIMTFVFAGAIVTALVLVLAITRIMPLEKTHIFFLTTTPHDNLEISLQSVPVNDDNMNLYKESFVKEYIIARNEIYPNAGAMQRKWAAGPTGQVYTWSDDAIYKNFANRQMVNALLSDIPEFEFRCFVNFRGGVQPRAENKYAVVFNYSCGQGQSKDYTITIKLDDSATRIRWDSRLRNPLGIKVVEYTVEAGGSDPLDFNWN